MGAYIARDQDRGREPRTVREFIGEFRGLSGSAKQKLILDEIGAARLSLPELFGTTEADTAAIAKLLEAMQRHTKPVKSKDLGIIGRDHFAERFKSAGADLRSFKYKANLGDCDGLPDIIETAFGWCPNNQRRIITGLNWSPAIGNPFRSLGPYGESLDAILAEQRSGPAEPIIFVLHLARPRFDYTDHGKTAVDLSGDDDE
jgi:hypothetical protein